MRKYPQPLIMRNITIFGIFFFYISNPAILSAQDDVPDLNPLSVPAYPQDPDELRAVRSENYVVTPGAMGFKPELLEQLDVPAGFTVSVFAEDLGNARIIAVTDDGHIFVSRREQGAVALLRDNNGDGKADQVTDVVTGKDNVHGLAVYKNMLYMVTNNELFRAPVRKDGSLGKIEQLRDDLPDGGQHPNRTLGFGPDGKLYLSVGSTCNDCDEPRDEHATLLRMDEDGRNQEIFAKGLRNTIGFGWHPETDELWGFDHNSDGRGNDVPPEQLNHIQEGKHYGWPWVYGNREIDFFTPEPPPNGMSREEFSKTTEPMVMGYKAHSAPMQLTYYTGSAFPEEYKNDAFVAMRGSWNRNPPVGYEVVRVRFSEGKPQSIEPFISGWLSGDGKSHFGRLVGIAEHPDGYLLLGDDKNGIMYRIAYEK
jgi:glucose/arabinose dehydrogenase